jgi:hypothetical protein
MFGQISIDINALRAIGHGNFISAIICYLFFIPKPDEPEKHYCKKKLLPLSPKTE